MATFSCEECREVSAVVWAYEMALCAECARNYAEALEESTT